MLRKLSVVMIQFVLIIMIALSGTASADNGESPENGKFPGRTGWTDEGHESVVILLIFLPGINGSLGGSLTGK